MVWGTRQGTDQKIVFQHLRERIQYHRLQSRRSQPLVLVRTRAVAGVTPQVEFYIFSQWVLDGNERDSNHSCCCFYNVFFIQVRPLAQDQTTALGLTMVLDLTMENSDHLGLTLAGLIIADLAPIMGLGLTMAQTMEPLEALEHSKTMVQDQDATALVVVVAVALILVHPLKTVSLFALYFLKVIN